VIIKGTGVIFSSLQINKIIGIKIIIEVTLPRKAEEKAVTTNINIIISNGFPRASLAVLIAIYIKIPVLRNTAITSIIPIKKKITFQSIALRAMS
jgi:hypothetical protein